MTSGKSSRRPLLLALAGLFAGATVFYSAIWMFDIRHPFADFGLAEGYVPKDRCVRVARVEPRSAEDRAGLRPGDRIVAINGRGLDTVAPLYNSLALGKVGDVVELTLQRPGATAPLQVREVLQPLRLKTQGPRSGSQLLAGEVLNFYPLLFLAVGLPVLFLRVEDRNAWLLALVFGGFVAAAPLDEAWVPSMLRGFAVSYKETLAVLLPAVFYLFFATFPASSPLDRRLPWLKWALLAVGALVAVPLGLWCLLAGGGLPFYIMSSAPAVQPAVWIFLVYIFGSYTLGLVSLVWNSLHPTSVEARRKTRVIVWGTVAALLPTLVFSAVVGFAHLTVSEIPFWIYVFVVVSLFLIPLSFAYAVVKHRVLEIPVLLKRSARYLLVQRGFGLLTALVTTAAILLFISVFTRFFRANSKVALPTGMGVGIAFGAISTLATLNIRTRVTKRIDRAFFRSSYDARQVLEHLAEKTRTATTRGEVDALLAEEIQQALHPKFMAVYLETADACLGTDPGQGIPAELREISAHLPELAEVARRGQPWEVPPAEAGRSQPLSTLAPLGAECLVPMLGRDGRLVGLVALGPRLSEESYAREDKRLLASVASQAGMAVESIRLAEEMAERMEAERRAAQEMAIAREVQAKLFPQKLPPLATLEYAGACFQARQVGGDYYDFLDLGPGRVGFVLADVAGKGISGALLMANLQANLRSQYAVALKDLPRLLESVNRLFYENTTDSSYATLFFADFDDASRCLRYANCGHPPPLLLRAQGTVESLVATSTVLGLFSEWECSLAEVRLAPGDVLVVYTDGVSEATDSRGEEFGERRLLESLLAFQLLPPAEMLSAVVSRVRDFAPGEQADDLTLLIARAR